MTQSIIPPAPDAVSQRLEQIISKAAELQASEILINEYHSPAFIVNGTSIPQTDLGQVGIQEFHDLVDRIFGPNAFHRLKSGEDVKGYPFILGTQFNASINYEQKPHTNLHSGDFEIKMYPVAANVPPVPAAAPQVAHDGSFLAPVAATKKPKSFGLGLAIGAAGGVLLSVLVGGLIAVAGAVGAEANASSAIPDAVKACNATGSGVNVGDKGKSVSFDTKGKDDSSGASIDDVACVLGKLNVPDSVVSQMDHTNALQGRQTADWDGFNASWSYHPDSGLNLIVKSVTK